MVASLRQTRMLTQWMTLVEFSWIGSRAAAGISTATLKVELDHL